MFLFTLLAESPLHPSFEETQERKSGDPDVQRAHTRALLAVSHVGSTARRVMVPAVTT